MLKRNPDLPGWIIKRARHDKVGQRPDYRSDTHLYRVRKAKKINATLIKNGDDSLFVVPKKYLYTKDNEQVVVAEQMVGQKFQNTDRFTPEQTRALTRLVTQGLFTDIHHENFLKREDGKIAIIDTEPVSRGVKKANRNILTYLCGASPIFDVKMKIETLARLAKYCAPEAIPIIERAQRRYICKQVALVVAKIAIAAILLITLPKITAAAIAYTGVIIGASAIATATAAASKVAIAVGLCLKGYIGGRVGTLVTVPFTVYNAIKTVRKEDAQLQRLELL